MLYSVSGDRLQCRGREVPFVPSPNCGGRIEPHLIVLHDTADRLRPDDTVSWFATSRSKVSAHLVVGRDGSIVQMVDFDRAAWHAGKSSWRGRANCNGWSIGVEIDNPGKLVRRGDKAFAWFGEGWPLDQCVEMATREHGAGWWLPYTREQIEAVQRIVVALCDRFPTISEVVTHYQISPGRKVDVGPQFPLDQVLPLVPLRTRPSKELVEAVQTQLLELGYQPGTPDGIDGPMTRSAVREFEEQNGLTVDGIIDDRLRVALWQSGAKGPVTGPREAKSKSEVLGASGTMQSAAMVKRTTEAGAIANIVNAGTAPIDVPAAVAQTPPEPNGVIFGAPGLSDGLSSLSGGLDAVDKARGATERLSGLIDWLMSPAGIKFVIVSGILAAIWFGAHRVEWRRYRDFVLGRHKGGV